MTDYYYCRFCPRVERCWQVWDYLGGALCEMPISSVSFRAPHDSKCSGSCGQNKEAKKNK
jgi:hypothetical protein